MKTLIDGFEWLNLSFKKIVMRLMLWVLSMIFPVSFLLSCSCFERLSFCHMINSETDEYGVLKGRVVSHRVLDTIFFSEEYFIIPSVAYVEVEYYFRNSMNYSDTLKLIGDGTPSSNCIFDVNNFEIGDQLYLGIRHDTSQLQYYPDSIDNHLTSIVYNICSVDRLYRSSENTIFGSIDEGVYNFPFELIDEKLSSCDSDFTESIKGVGCSDEYITLYPNPTTDGIIRIKEVERFLKIREEPFSIYNSAGEFIAKSTPVSDGQVDYKIELRSPGVYFLRFNCNGVTKVRKIIYIDSR